MTTYEDVEWSIGRFLRILNIQVVASISSLISYFTWKQLIIYLSLQLLNSSLHFFLVLSKFIVFTNYTFSMLKELIVYAHVFIFPKFEFSFFS